MVFDMLEKEKRTALKKGKINNPYCKFSEEQIKEMRDKLIAKILEAPFFEHKKESTCQD